jgi:hypothetical protein
MLNKKIKAVLLFGFLGFSSGALSNDTYIGGGIASIDISDNGPNVNAFIGRFGKSFNENITGEVRVGFGMKNRSFENPDYVKPDYLKTNYEVGGLFGTYLKIGAAASDNIYPYAVVGLTQTKVTKVTKVSLDGVSETVKISESKLDPSLGLGVELGNFETGTITIEYMNYVDKSIFELSGFSIGFTMAF